MTIKITFVDMWFKNIHNNRFINKFSNEFKFDIKIDDKNPDYVIYSIFGKKHEKYKEAKKVFICWEPINIYHDKRIKKCDYSVTYYLNLKNKKHFYFPPVMEKAGFHTDFIDLVNTPPIIKKKKFCCFVVSTDKATPDRKNFFKKLCEYKKVDSFGKVLKNCDVKIPGRSAQHKWGTEYFNIIGEYKFMITFENILENGVSTEKIYNAFMANTVPIFWGNKSIYQIFNKGSFINAHDFETMDKLIEYVKEVDNDEGLYNQILNNKKFIYDDPNYYKKIYENIWKTIFDIKPDINREAYIDIWKNIFEIEPNIYKNNYKYLEKYISN